MLVLFISLFVLALVVLTYIAQLYVMCLSLNWNELVSFKTQTLIRKLISYAHGAVAENALLRTFRFFPMIASWLQCVGLPVGQRWVSLMDLHRSWPWGNMESTGLQGRLETGEWPANMFCTRVYSNHSWHIQCISLLYSFCDEAYATRS